MYLLAAEVDAGTALQELINSSVTGIHDVLDKLGSFFLGTAQESWDAITDFFGFVEVLAEIPDLFVNYLWPPLALSVGLVISIAISKLVMEVLT